MQNDTALLLFSGGQDSTLCLADALTRFERVETLGFDYGQRHKIELSCRQAVLSAFRECFPSWGERLGDDHTLDLPALAQIGGTALIGDGKIAMQDNGLPSSFVAGRNLLFLTYATALAYRRGIGVVVGGMCETDYSGYPDCRRETIDALTEALRLAMEWQVSIETPLMHKSKAESWAWAYDLGGDDLVALIIEHSHSCYYGEREQRHEWGYGCDDCPACTLRKQGYEEWRASL